MSVEGTIARRVRTFATSAVFRKYGDIFRPLSHRATEKTRVDTQTRNTGSTRRRAAAGQVGNRGNERRPPARSSRSFPRLPARPFGLPLAGPDRVERSSVTLCLRGKQCVCVIAKQSA